MHHLFSLDVWIPHQTLFLSPISVSIIIFPTAIASERPLTTSLVSFKWQAKLSSRRFPAQTWPQQPITERSNEQPGLTVPPTHLSTNQNGWHGGEKKKAAPSPARYR